MTPVADRACSECGFAWDLSFDDAVAIVGRAPQWFAKVFERGPFAQQADGVWSATGYLWHVNDVLRFGTERFWVLQLDPRRGISPWDADAMAAARSYDDLSPLVGLHALTAATREWLAAAAATPRYVTAAHPDFGAIDAMHVAARHAHEVVHHLMDVRRQLRDS
ncbi:MAG: hypothetical protein JWM93_3532 [Frankiales bacterium]|nr:hypothetical protein [Frankiales bacterium]